MADGRHFETMIGIYLLYQDTVHPLNGVVLG
jgi:hypothetical protein